MKGVMKGMRFRRRIKRKRKRKPMNEADSACEERNLRMPDFQCLEYCEMVDT